MMINLNRQTVFVLCTTFGIGMALGWIIERDRINRKIFSVVADQFVKRSKEEESE